jgi:hypothetical protein
MAEEEKDGKEIDSESVTLPDLFKVCAILLRRVELLERAVCTLLEKDDEYGEKIKEFRDSKTKKEHLN